MLNSSNFRVKMLNEKFEEQDHLVEALNKLGDGSKFLCLIFILSLTAPIFNGLHSMSYIFISEIPPHWCSIPELTLSNWTSQQIRNISPASPCTKYNYNYTYFSEMGYEETINYIEKLTKKPTTSSCSTFTYQDIGRSTIVEEWDLICEKAAYRANTFMAIALGKLLGAGLFGIYADKYGRKRTFIVGVILIIFCSPASAIVPWFWVYMILRFLTGFSAAAYGYACATILTEVSGPRYRQFLGIAYNTGFPSGTALTAAFAYIFPDWRHLLMAIAIASLILIINAWIIPESPRWLIAQNRRYEAKKIIERFHGPVGTSSIPMLKSSTPNNHKIPNSNESVSKGTSPFHIELSMTVLFCLSLINFFQCIDISVV